MPDAPPHLLGASKNAFSSSSSISSFLSKVDKIQVLRTIESLHERDLTGTTLTAAWERYDGHVQLPFSRLHKSLCCVSHVHIYMHRLAKRSVSAGPRAPHLPLLHEDRAFALLLDRTWASVPHLSPGHCSSIVGNLAKLRYRPQDEFLADILATCRQHADTQSFGQAARLLGGLARLDYDFQEQELTKLAGVMHHRLLSMDLEAFYPESLSSGLWALSVLGALNSSDRDDLRERLLAAAIHRLKFAHEEAIILRGGRTGENVLTEGKAKNLVRMCRQLKTSLLFLPSGPSSSAMLSQEEENVNAVIAAAMGIQQPHQQPNIDSTLHYQSCIPSSQQELAKRIDEVWEDLGAWLDPARQSRLQLEVEDTLKIGGGVCAREWDDGVVTVDIALHPRPGVRLPTTAAAAKDKDETVGSPPLRPVALEVDGPSHFFINQPQRPTGDSKIKHQALHVGYPKQWAAVISVPHFEWPSQERQRLALLQKKLANAGLEPAHFLVPGREKETRKIVKKSNKEKDGVDNKSPEKN